MGSEVRVDSLAESKLSQMLDQLETDLQQLKSGAPQYIGGGSIASFESATGNAFDFTGILTQDPLNPTNHNLGRSNWLITATADHANILYGTVFVFMWVNSTTTRYKPSNYLADLGGGLTGFQTFILDVSTNPPSASNQRSWSLQITGDRTRTLRWKAYVIGLDSANLAITQTL